LNSSYRKARKELNDRFENRNQNQNRLFRSDLRKTKESADHLSKRIEDLIK
jgi:hypothetical protein